MARRRLHGALVERLGVARVTLCTPHVRSTVGRMVNRGIGEWRIRQRAQRGRARACARLIEYPEGSQVMSYKKTLSLRYL